MDITNFIASHRNDALLLGDYNAYRAQLSRRLLTLRRKLGRASPKGRKYAPQIAVTAQDVAGDHEFVHLLLLTSERAWAHAMHMKSTHSADTSTKGITGSARRHIISRLRKASNYANQLVRLLQDRSITGASAENVLEARAYLSSLAGSIEFEKQGWERCVKHYAKAHMIYTALATSTTKDVFKDLLNNIIDPSIRYAAYQLRLPRTLAVATIARRHFPRSDAELIAEIEKLDSDLFSEPIPGAKKVSGKENDNLPRTVSWRSRTVNLEDASIAQALASVIVAEETLSGSLSTSEDVEMSAKEKAAAYDGVLISSQDAVDATKSAIDELNGEGVGPGDKRMQALQVTRTAVNYALIGWRIGRNRILCGEHDGAILEVETIQKPKKPRKDGKEWIPRKEGTGRKLARLRECVVLYDATLQSLDSVKELPGVAADEAFMTELEAKREYFQALK
ncbi:MAG: hypothetical protein M1830_000552 [Pleopsidium flavum]|nr:MAG: hypothetical protein M1830_000552 [Pleopsidium flavum]